MEKRDGRSEVFGVRFDNVSVEEAAARAEGMIRHGPYHYCVGTNADLLRMARRDANYREAINNADLSLADGIGVICAARILKVSLEWRVACIDLLDSLLPRLDEARVYILGGKPGTADQAKENLLAQYPYLSFCGTHHGYFQDPEKMALEISASSPALLLVCLGSPKQEFFMSRYGHLTGANLACGCGGWIDIAAGKLKRAPLSWRKSNLEWTWRFFQEPWRIGRVCRSLAVPLLAYGELTRNWFQMVGGKKPCRKRGTDERDPR